VKANKSTIFYILLVVLVFVAPMRSIWRSTALVALLLYPLALSRLKLWTYRLARGGSYDKALRFDHILGFMPFYGDSLEGSILFNAGKYAEARTFLKPLAFDKQGEPRLTSTSLYLYTLALTNDDRAEDALPLLEAAARVPASSNSMRVALAGCLLTLGKDPYRACALLEDVLARDPVPAYAVCVGLGRLRPARRGGGTVEGCLCRLVFPHEKRPGRNQVLCRPGLADDGREGEVPHCFQ
jgi:hypothetical protein